MIYLQNITTSQSLNVPKSADAPSGQLVFKAKSTIDLTTDVNVNVTDAGTSDQYFVFSVTLPSGLADGEYEYSLSVGTSVVATGLLVIGSASSPSQYNTTITYEQYESE